MEADLAAQRLLMPAPRSRVSPPPWLSFHLHGRRIFFNPVSLAVGETEAEISAAASTSVPEFPLTPPGPPAHLVLNVTHACNLACRYCFAAKYWEAATMTPAVAERAVALLADGPRERAITLSFFGGEPLLAWETLMAGVAAAERLGQSQGRRVHLHITTNGALLDADKAEYLAQHGFSVLISLDGPEDIHNAARPMRNGGNSWRATMAALAHLRASGSRPAGRRARVTLRGTYLPGRAGEAADHGAAWERANLRERCEFYGRLMDSGYCAGFSLEAATLTEGGAGRTTLRVDEEGLRREYHEVALWYLDRLRRGRPPGFFHFNKILERLRRRRPQVTECGAGRSYLTIGPDGSIFACHRETGTRIGHLDTGFDAVARARWLDNRLTQRDACRDCWCRYVCGGGCRQRAAELGRPLSEPDPDACAVMRIMVAECLWLLLHLPPRPAGGKCAQLPVSPSSYRFLPFPGCKRKP